MSGVVQPRANPAARACLRRRRDGWPLGGAFSAAAHAVSAAVDAGLRAQWRCRIGNEASLRLADRLGFTRMGTQSAVALARPS